MAKYLRIHVATTSPETASAQEYQSDVYLSRPALPALSAVVWETGALPIEQLAVLLRERGWHQTDIGDELSVARAAHSVT